MIGKADYDILNREWRIILYDEAGTNPVAITFEFKQHPITIAEPLPYTRLAKNPGCENVLRALAQALQEIGLFQADAKASELQGELKATKYHLEDMRKLFIRDLGMASATL